MRRDYRQSVPLGQQLRAVGQALEDMGVQNFELEVDRSGFVVRGKVSVKAQEPAAQGAQETSAGGLGRFFRSASPERASTPSAPPEPSPVELRFTPEEIDQLERAGQMRREAAPGMPGFGAAQMLRTIGDYLDRQGHKLLRVEKLGPAISIDYQTASGQRNTENRTNSSLYDLSVRMYLRRSDR